MGTADYTAAELDPDEDGVVNLYVEAVRRSDQVGGDSITLELEIPGLQQGLQCLSDTIKLTSCELQVLDLRHWGPTWNPTTGAAGITSTNLDAEIPDSAVGGAITDGASICLVRVVPFSGAISSLGPWSVGLVKASDPSVNIPAVVGRFASAQPTSLPLLPSTFEYYAGDDQPSTGNLAGGKLFYVPPHSYLSPLPGNGPQVLNALETCAMTFQVKLNNALIGATPFVLRRPPLMLVHGILSSPATWDPLRWNETGAPVFTRIYMVDWSATGSKGYAENFGRLALKIDEAVNDYRTATDGAHNPNRSFRGLRYAATRADVVGHSQGGQIARWYIADGMPPYINRIGWTADILNQRTEDDLAGKWPYLRNDNFGAGSIRRFITLGSPFRGSPLANTASTVLAPGDPGPKPLGYQALYAWYQTGLMPAALESLLYGPTGDYLEPTCVADLSEGSDAQLALELALFPAGHKQVRWFPIIGIATDPVADAPAEAVLWQLLFEFLPLIPSQQDPDQPFLPALDPLLPPNSDLIVPVLSQRNAATLIGHPNSMAGESFDHTTHIHINDIFVGETKRSEIAEKVGDLLSRPPSHFNPSWSLGP